jgi:hypothetical protein
VPSCQNSDQCPAGLYCQIGFTYRCQFCGSNAPLHMQTDASTGETFNAIFDPGFAGFNASLVRQVCARAANSRGLGPTVLEDPLNPLQIEKTP